MEKNTEQSSTFVNRKANFHTHSTYCDGKSTLEENIESALSKNFKILGFSSHSAYPAKIECSIKHAEFEKYSKEIDFLKEKYKDRIEILKGFEADFIPSFCKPNFSAYGKFSPDFLIGSVHFLYNGEENPDDAIAVDNTPEILLEGLERIYGGNVKKLAGHYFSLQREMLACGNFSIIGHIDLIRKFNGTLKLFDESEEWYKNELKETASAIKKAGVIAEINTGAIARGYTKTPYPSEYFLSLLRERNVPVTVSSDAHKAEFIDFGFEQALSLARKAGYKEIAILRENSNSTETNRTKIEFVKI